MYFLNRLCFLKKYSAAAAAIAILPLAVACGSADVSEEVSEEVAIDEVPAETVPEPTEEMAAESEAADSGTIVDVAMADGSFETLVAAVQAAGLAETLSSDGPFTVFAPTDEAFAALPDGILDTLLLPENQETLQQILTYHVVAAEVPSSAIEPGAVGTVAGEEVTLSTGEGGVTVNEATVVLPDVTASNGIIHVIDAVLLPPSLDLSAL